LVVLTSDTPDLPGWHAASFALAHFEPLVRLYFDPDVLLVRPDASWMDLAALRKAGPLRVGLVHHPIYSSSLLEWLTGQLGLELQPVFDEDPMAIWRQLHDGTLDAVVLGLGDTRDELAAGRLRGLAVASDEPVTAPVLLPTFAEQGHPLVSGRWAGVLVPKAIDATTRKRLEQDLLDGLPLALREPEAQSLMSGLEAEWHVRPAKAFRAFLNFIEDNQRQITPESGVPELPPGKFVGLVVTIVGVLLFPALMQLVGFPLGAFVFLAGLMALLWPRLEWRALLQILPVALVLAIGLNWVFWHVFYVVFPEGFFTGF
jgi:tripartite-type tricarboxylate transporter receptor subunit TctC